MQLQGFLKVIKNNCPDNERKNREIDDIHRVTAERGRLSESREEITCNVTPKKKSVFT